MNSKAWKILAFAPVVIGLLTGCGANKKHHGPSSPYSGVWVEKDYIDIYRQHARDDRFNSTLGFCDIVAHEPDALGIDPQSRNVNLNAISISDESRVARFQFGWGGGGYRDGNAMGSYPGGQGYDFESLYNPDNISVIPNTVGNVSDDGSFYVNGQSQAQSPAIGYYYRIDENNITYYFNRNTRRHINYTRSSVQEIKQFLSVIYQCEYVIQTPSYGDGGGGQGPHSPAPPEK